MTRATNVVLSFDEEPKSYCIDPYLFDRNRRFSTWAISGATFVHRTGQKTPFHVLPAGESIVARSQAIRMHNIEDPSGAGLRANSARMQIKQALTKVGRTSFLLSYHIELNKGDGSVLEPIAENETVMVHLKNGAPAPFSMPIKPAVSLLPGSGTLSALIQEKFSAIQPDTLSPAFQFTIITRMSDEDVNQHIHNTVYFRYFTDALSAYDVALHRDLSTVSTIGINYEKECKGNQAVRVNIHPCQSANKAVQEELYMTLINSDKEVITRCWMEIRPLYCAKAQRPLL